MQKLVWQNANGDEIDLTSGHYGITDWQGFSGTELNIQSQQVPFQDGSVFLDALLSERELSVTLAINDENNLKTRYRLRRELIHILNPKLGEGYLIYTNDFISKRIKCVPQSPLFPNKNSNDPGTPKASLAWTACNPYWEDLEDSTFIINADEINNIENNGDVPCQLDIDFYNIGSENISVTNVTKDKSILVSGTHNKIVNINTGTGTKSVENKEIKAETFLVNNYYELKYACYDSFNKDYIYVGSNNIIIKTKDLKTFEVYKIDYNIEKIYYFSETKKFIGIDSNNVVIYSSDAITWAESNITYYLYDVLYINNKYYAYTNSGSDTLIFESVNGETWTSTTLSNINIKDIAYSEELEIFIGISQNAVYTSSDFIEWTQKQTFSAYDNFQKICYIKNTNLVIASVYTDYSHGGDKYLRCYYSSDGESWNNATMSENYRASVAADISGNRSRGFYIVSGVNVYNSVTGESWEKVETKTESIDKILKFESIGDFILIGSKIFETLLTNQIKMIPASNIKDIAYSKKLNLYVMISQNEIYTSKNKIIWNKVAQYNSSMGQILYVEKFNKFFIVIDSGSSFKYYTSENGTDWTEHSTLLGMAYARQIIYVPELEKLFIVGKATSSTNGIIAYSLDGLSWSYGSTTDVPSTPFKEIYSLAYSEDKKRLIAIGYTNINNSTTYYSDDGGQKWSYRVSANGYTLNYSKYLKKIFSTNAYTIDGLSWTRINNLALDQICFSEDLAFFIGIKGTNCYISYNCQEWNLLILNLKSEVNFNNIRYIKDDNTFYLVGKVSGTTSLYTYIELKLERGENIISKISSNSDMSLNLEVGVNEIRISCEEGFIMGKITYRQKYIGV